MTAWDFMYWQLNIPAIRSKKAIFEATQLSLIAGIRYFEYKYGFAPARVTVHELGKLELEDILLEESKSTTPGAAFMWRKA